MLVFHNTFVSPARALNLQTPATSHHFALANNVIHGPSAAGPRVADWSAPIDDGTIDFNGWFPNGTFDFDAAGTWASFAAMQAAGVFEASGVLLAPGTFASGLVAPPTYETTMAPQDVTLAPGSPAVDAGTVLPNLNDGFTGAAPDLGALEVGCPIPLFGVRPEGVDETNAPIGCGGPTVTTTTSTTTTSTTLPWVLVRTSSLTLKDDSTAPANPAARRISFKSSTQTDPLQNRIVPPPPGSAGDPTLGGGVLVVYDTAGSGERVTVSLPAFDPLTGSGWSAVGGGWRFRGRDPDGPVSSVTVQPNRIIVKGGKSAWGYTLDEPSQGRIALRLTLGGGRPWCAEVPARVTGNPPSTSASDRVDRFVGQPKTPPPPSCPPVP
jgi:hypothetical protein